MWTPASPARSGTPRSNTPPLPRPKPGPPGSPALARYLGSEVTGQPGQSMGAYWERTRT